MEELKHECGVAMIRLLKPLSYYEQKYGSWEAAQSRTGGCWYRFRQSDEGARHGVYVP